VSQVGRVSKSVFELLKVLLSPNGGGVNWGRSVTFTGCVTVPFRYFLHRLAEVAPRIGQFIRESLTACIKCTPPRNLDSPQVSAYCVKVEKGPIVEFSAGTTPGSMPEEP